MPAPGGLVTPHLWIVVTEPHRSFETVIVKLTTLRFDRDRTVILQRGAHPFIKHETVVQYGDALIVDGRQIDLRIQEGTAVAHQPCSASMLELVQDGLLASEFTPRRVTAFCRQAWGST